MVKSTVVARVLDGERLECRVVSPAGNELTLSGGVTDQSPELDGAAGLVENPTLVNNAWAFARYTYQSVNLPDVEQQANAAKRAQGHRKVVEWIADVTDGLTDEVKRAWCSACFGEHEHQRATRPVGQLPAYLCSGCGSPTLPCAAPRCANFAVRSRGALRVPRYCAEHRHEIPGFEKTSRTMGSLEDYEDFLKFDKKNWRKNTQLVGTGIVGITLGAPAAMLAAPAIGGAVGVTLSGPVLGTSLYGAAAANWGLALLGGGSVAAGGFGMVGGTMVVTAAGGALGGALSASLMNAYVHEDKSFRIEKLRDGSGVPVVVCNGFLTQGDAGWGEWHDIVTSRYPDSAVYRVHWGAKELKHLGFLAGGGAAKFISGAAVKGVAEKAAKVGAKKLGPLAPALVAADLAKNPWHVAKTRADKTGVVLADLLVRTDAEAYVLVGHSLGARAMVVAAQTLGSKPTGPRVQAAHLLGTAIGAKSDWSSLASAVEDAVYNYHSTNDNVLKLAYPVAQVGQSAAGLKGFTPVVGKIENIDVSELVKSHSEYLHNVQLS